MHIQKRILRFVNRSNWILLALGAIGGFLLSPPNFAKGILFGGLIVTINFHLLARTLKKALTPPNLASHNVILAKYYVRFFISGLILFFLIKGNHVHPLGLFIGLSVVVASIMLATLIEIKHLIVKEAF